MTSPASRSVCPFPARILLISHAALSFPAISLASHCPIEVGQVISAEAPRTAFNRLSQMDVTKGEFETTEQYEARMAAMDGQSSGAIRVKAPFDPNDTEYDADRELLRLWVYAFDNEGASWKYALEPRGVPSLSDSNRRFQRFGRSSKTEFGVGLGTENSVIGQYEASNAYGTSVTVTEIDRQVYSVYQGEILQADKWHLDGRGTFESSLGPLPDTGYIEIPIPLAEARDIKESLQIVLAFTPSSPFTATGSKQWDPKINQPEEIHASYNVMIGQIHCLGVLDGKGKALHTILPTSEPERRPKTNPKAKKGEWI